MAVSIDRWLVGPGNPCFVIAEAGVNHNGDMGLAHRLIDAAADCGADAVKFQAFVTEELVTRAAPKANYQLVNTQGDGAGTAQFSMLKALELSAEQLAELKRHCEERQIAFLCTPYDARSVDVLDQMGVSAFKIASTDTTNTPLLRYIAAKGRPVILSSGMSTLAEVEAAMEALSAVRESVVLLHCTSEYPAPVEETNLRAMAALALAFGCPVGLSDHSVGIQVSAWAVAAGAVMLEKHFTLDCGAPGPDHQSSIEPAGLAELVRTVRLVERALGDGRKRLTASEAKNKPWMQKSLTVRRPMRAGELFTSADLAVRRPGTGLPPSWLDRVIGRRVAQDLPADAVLKLASVDWSGGDEDLSHALREGRA